jgi:hypothetical protein
MTVASQVKQTLSGLKSATATLRLYKEQAADAQVRAAYQEAVKTTQAIVKDLEDRLKVLEFEEPQYKGN